MVQGAIGHQGGRAVGDMPRRNVLSDDVPFDAEGFRRTRYGFRVTVEGDGYRVEASPQGPVGRAFVVDDSGFVRLLDD